MQKPISDDCDTICDIDVKRAKLLCILSKRMNKLHENNIAKANLLKNYNQSEEKSNKDNNWYNRKGLVIGSLIIFYPLGLYALYKTNTFSKIGKTAIALIVIIVLAIIGSHQGKEVNQNESSKVSHESTEINKVKSLTVTTNSLGMNFVYCPPGIFVMGSSQEVSSEPHKVTLTRGFYMQTTEVTQSQWKAVMGNNPSREQPRSDDRPVEKVSWDDCQQFIQKLNEMESKTDYRLPTEAEWEYACRAGSSTTYCFGDSDASLGDYAWYSGNSDYVSHPVAQKQPNDFGLYDMHGNVWEWCNDWYESNFSNSPQTDPVGPDTGSLRVFRGGSWYHVADGCRSAKRRFGKPDERNYHLGFRVVSSQAP